VARVAIFGGTFDPVHNGHLALATAAADTLGLDRVIFIPAGNPPFKGGAMALFDDRARMLELALAENGDTRFEVSRIEEPVDGDNPSYSVVTVERLLQQGLEAPLGFIVGADAFADLTKWHRWNDLARMVEFIVAPREGSVVTPPPGVVAHALPNVVSPVSSSAVRQMLGAGRADIPVAPGVLHFIRQQALYT